MLQEPKNIQSVERISLSQTSENHAFHIATGCIRKIILFQCRHSMLEFNTNMNSKFCAVQIFMKSTQALLNQSGMKGLDVYVNIQFQLQNNLIFHSLAWTKSPLEEDCPTLSFLFISFIPFTNLKIYPFKLVPGWYKLCSLNQ